MELRRPRSEVTIRNILMEGPILTRQFCFKKARLPSIEGNREE